jgi:penicillin-binding protein 1A
MATKNAVDRQVTAVAVVVALVAFAPACTYTTRDVTPTIPPNAQSSRLFAADGRLLATLHGEENREEIPLDRIPRSLQDAVLAIEDERFYDHPGVDLRAILRALAADASSGEVEQGGSTITQQYVKNTLVGDDQTIERKLEEAALAFELERHYTKQRILELYLNTIYFGNGAYGVQAAAHEYFGKTVDQLTTAESALLAGLIQSPSTTDPFDQPIAALTRRSVVLDKMVELGMLSRGQADAANVTPLGLTAGAALDERYPAGHFVEEVKQWILADERFGATKVERLNLLFNGGLRIYTTLDLDLQAKAEAAVAAVLPDPTTSPEVALVAVEPSTGFVRAMVGGRDFFGGGAEAKFNLAVGKGRPTGSAFKPVVLAAALEMGIPLTEKLPAPGAIDLPLPNGQVWHVHNADPDEGNPTGVDLVEGTVHSFNTLYAQLILQVGPDRAVDMATRLGITTPLQAVPAAVLGTNDVRVLDMASVYGTFANRGVAVPPTMVTRVTRPDGTLLYEAPHAQTKVIEAGIADQVTSVLEQVVERGTGTRAALDRPAAGKTGTGEEYADAWFCGYTPDLATAVWVGFPAGEISMRPPTTPIRVYGGTWPAQVWRGFMAGALDGRPPVDFPVPTTTTTLPPPTTEPPPTTVTTVDVLYVPDVVGLAADVAAAAVQQRGLNVEVVYEPAPTVPPNAVWKQEPAAHVAATPGSLVMLWANPPVTG